ncbi:MDR family MFS transporter [soil metagenome]
MHNPPTTTDLAVIQNRARRPLIVTGLIMAMFLSAIEATIVATAMPTVIKDLGGLSLYGLVGASYLLASTVTIPLYGRLADLRGRKVMMLRGIGLFLAGSTICAFAPRLGILVLGRVIQGLGAGAMQPITMTLIGDLFSLEERGRIQGLMGTVWGLAGVSGPLIGALLVRSLGWRSIFWLNLPFGLFAAGIIAWSLREPARAVNAPRVDWSGAGLLIFGSGALLAATTGYRILPFTVVGVALITALIVAEQRIKDPLLPIELLTRRDVVIGSLSALLVGACFMGIINFLPLFLQTGLGLSPAIAGSSLSPLLVGWPIAATLSSTFIVRTGFRTPLVVGAFVIATAMIGLRIWMMTPVTIVIYPIMFVLGAGFGLTTSSVIIAVQTSVHYHQRGLATAFNMFSRSMGGAVGVGIAGLLVGVAFGSEGASASAVAQAPHLLIHTLGNVFLVLAGLAVIHIPLCWAYPPTNAIAQQEAGDHLPPVAALME